MKKSASFSIVKGDGDKVDATLVDNMLKVQLDRDGGRRVRKYLKDEFAELKGWLMGRHLCNVKLFVRNIRSWLSGECGYGIHQNVIDKQREAGDRMPGHLRLVPLANVERQSFSRNLHTPKSTLSPNAKDNGVSCEVDVEVGRGENVGIVESGQELVDGCDGEPFVANLRIQEAGRFVIGLKIGKLTWTVELNGFSFGISARNQINSA